MKNYTHPNSHPQVLKGQNWQIYANLLPSLTFASSSSDDSRMRPSKNKIPNSAMLNLVAEVPGTVKVKHLELLLVRLYVTYVTSKLEGFCKTANAAANLSAPPSPAVMNSFYAVCGLGLASGSFHAYRDPQNTRIVILWKPEKVSLSLRTPRLDLHFPLNMRR